MAEKKLGALNWHAGCVQKYVDAAVQQTILYNEMELIR